MNTGAKGAQEVHTAQEGQGVQEVHERGTRGAPEEHEKGARGAREVYSLALNENGYFSFWHTWDMVGTRASKVHKRCTRDAREGHKRCTRGAREVHERCTNWHLMETVIFHFGTKMQNGKRERKLKAKLVPGVFSER